MNVKTNYRVRFWKELLFNIRVIYQNLKQSRDSLINYLKLDFSK